MFHDKSFVNWKFISWILWIALFLFEGQFPSASFGLDTAVSTPFDQKLSVVGILGRPPARADEPPRSSMEALFAEARSFRYVSDERGDHWQSPEETEVRGSGDCEDKAIWLYSLLVRQGFANIRLVVGKHKDFKKVFHVWVTYKDASGETHILDPTLRKRIWPTSQFTKEFYVPYYSYDSQGRYKHR